MQQDPGERSSDPSRGWLRLAPECPGVSSGGVGQGWPAAGLGAVSVAVHAWDLLKEVTIIFITSTIVLSQVNSREGTKLHPSTENWITDLLSIAPPIRTGPSFPLNQSLPSGSFYKPLTILHQRADRLKTTVTENKTIRSHGPQPCLTQWNCKPCRVGPPKTDGSWWRVLTKRGPLEKGMVNHFTILAFRTLWTAWKGKKIGHWKMNSSGQ